MRNTNRPTQNERRRRFGLPGCKRGRYAGVQALLPHASCRVHRIGAQPECEAALADPPDGAPPKPTKDFEGRAAREAPSCGHAHTSAPCSCGANVRTSRFAGDSRARRPHMRRDPVRRTRTTHVIVENRLRNDERSFLACPSF